MAMESNSPETILFRFSGFHGDAGAPDNSGTIPTSANTRPCPAQDPSLSI
jgi:hypothetical protein